MKYSSYIIIILLGLVLASCGRDGTTEMIDGKEERAAQYFPNMYRPVAYETYMEAEVFPDDIEAQEPVAGSVPRGWMPYEYEDDNEGYASAKANLENPIPLTEENLEHGKEMYGIYCAICHGDKGDGQGYLVKQEKILGVPAYNDRDLTPGSIYHVLYYGINNMGSYASQTSIKERWEIVHYVERLTAQLKGEDPKEPITDQSLPTLTPAVAKEGAMEEEPQDIIKEGDDVEQTDAQIINSPNDTLSNNNTNNDRLPAENSAIDR